jgi:glycosyltransferase involved in cell wall biosynthesis
MTPLTLSVVIPAFDAEATIGPTIDALAVALERAPAFAAEVVLVDDGSRDATAAAARAAARGRVPLTVVSQENRGRFEARRAGLERAAGDWVLLLDSRVTLDEGALAFLAERVRAGEELWNGHVHIDDGGSRVAAFWRLLAELAWADYFDHPRTTSFGAAEFDRYPTGTGCFLAPTPLLREAVGAARTRYADPRRANDDAPVLRWLARRRSIHLSPAFACSYEPRTSLAAFVRHSVHRGVVFLDGHGRPESRFYPVVIGFYPASALLAVLALRRPGVLPLAALAVGAAAGTLGIVRRRTPFETTTLAVVSPLYAAAHGLGMWSGLAHVVRRRVAPR